MPRQRVEKLEQAARAAAALGSDGAPAAAPPANEHADRVALFVRHACPDHHVRSASAHDVALQAATRLLRRHPEIAHDSFQTAIICGELETVQRTLAERPEAARERGGPKGWEPLLYLAFTRLSLAASNDNAMAIATALLDHGADPNVFFMAGDSRYTPLVGVIGEGEENRPPHAQVLALTRLLLERGAEPYDGQVIYNMHFHGNMLWFLELIHARAVQLGREADWRDPDWRMLQMGGYGSGARFLLGGAVAKDDIALARWILEHGASANAAPPTDVRMSKRSLYEDAVLHSYETRSAKTSRVPRDARAESQSEMVELLLEHDAMPSEIVLDEEDEFTVACLRLDRERVLEMLARHPEYLQSPKAITAAAERDRVEVVEMLLDLGVSPNIQDPAHGNQRPLHVAAGSDAPRVATLLIERGAEIDPVETQWGATPIGFAEHGQIERMLELLSCVSRNVWVLTSEGYVDRLREVLRAEPARARITYEGHTPLMWLPADEERAMEIAKLLLEHGADPTLVNAQGMTAAECANQRAMYEVEEVLRA